jgi:hypothetical protein
MFTVDPYPEEMTQHMTNSPFDPPDVRWLRYLTVRRFAVDLECASRL